MNQASCLAEYEQLSALRADVVARGLDHDRPTLGLTGLIDTWDTRRALATWGPASR